MKVLAFAGSGSSTSINKTLVTYAAGLIKNAKVELIDLRDYEMPLYTQDREKELGHPDLAHKFLAKIARADALVVSLAEHNGSYSVAYKNTFDWASRINMKVYQDKPMVLLAASPSSRGGLGVLETAKQAFPHFGADLKAVYSLPDFYENFDLENGNIRNADLAKQLKEAVSTLG